ncbi:MAG: hypothetical protein K0Q49_991 [Haloplasmataceae bacterium]|jgi:hypothetical protein|nr:hypothetical protein [Haloplasmataceae bacterium]
MKNKFDLEERNIKSRTKVNKIIEQNANEIINRFTESVDSLKNRFDLYDFLISINKENEADDILRFQIVYVMSALDLFMHELYTYSLVKGFFGEKRKTYRFNEYKVPLSLVEKAIKDPENIEKHLKATFIDVNSNFTFMHPNRIRDLLNIISYEDEFKMVEDSLKNSGIIKRSENLDDLLEDIYARRNKIAHQTDINRGEDERNKISKTDVYRYIEIIEHMVKKLFEIVSV